MSQFDKYKQKPPAVFTRMVGVNYGTFTIILEKLQVVFYKYQLSTCQKLGIGYN